MHLHEHRYPSLYETNDSASEHYIICGPIMLANHCCGAGLAFATPSCLPQRLEEFSKLHGGYTKATDPSVLPQASEEIFVNYSTLQSGQFLSAGECLCSSCLRRERMIFLEEKEAEFFLCLLISHIHCRHSVVIIFVLGMVCLLATQRAMLIQYELGEVVSVTFYTFSHWVLHRCLGSWCHLAEKVQLIFPLLVSLNTAKIRFTLFVGL